MPHNILLQIDDKVYLLCRGKHFAGLSTQREKLSANLYKVILTDQLYPLISYLLSSWKWILLGCPIHRAQGLTRWSDPLEIISQFSLFLV